METTPTEVTSYWIDPNGGSHEVGAGVQASHHRWVMRHRGISGEAAEHDGWHRIVVVPRDRELFTYGRYPLTYAQQHEVNRLAAHHKTPNIRTWVRAQQ